MRIAFALAFMLLAGAPVGFKQVGEVDGILLESRPVKGSSFAELRLTAVSDSTPESLCAAAFGDGKIDPSEKEVRARRVLEEEPDERVTYDRISAPMVSDRDYAVRVRRFREPNGVCCIEFNSVNALAPPRTDGTVRIEHLHGSWRFEPDAGATRVTYLIFADPGGSLPAWMVERRRRDIGVRWMKLILSRGKK